MRASIASSIDTGSSVSAARSASSCHARLVGIDRAVVEVQPHELLEERRVAAGHLDRGVDDVLGNLAAPSRADCGTCPPRRRARGCADRCACDRRRPRPSRPSRTSISGRAARAARRASRRGQPRCRAAARASRRRPTADRRARARAGCSRHRARGTAAARSCRARACCFGILGDRACRNGVGGNSRPTIAAEEVQHLGDLSRRAPRAPRA